ncbi:N1221-domain-containing protein [Rhizodiscina lignyota]|uniref:N1221-domain-containing protein n=1 Tax=Rhizodiscina lignyota TaxID=1504668 RepID=A0A9P4IFF8_9PEZI|nr:N1221-domain-containing protein [Rhizodiscina lignyota]
MLSGEAISARSGANDAASDTVDLGSQPPTLREKPGLPARPGVRRDSTVPAPHQPPPPAPPQPLQDAGPEDSLSLMQLKKLVHEMPKVEPTPYAFVYKDASIIPEELEEWFSYNAEERAMVLKTRATFSDEWANFNGAGDLGVLPYLGGDLDWTKASTEKRKTFMKKVLGGLESENIATRAKNLECLTYMIFGCWHETASVQRPQEETGCTIISEDKALSDWMSSHQNSLFHLSEICGNVALLVDLKGLKTLWGAVQRACVREASIQAASEERSPSIKDLERSELWCSLTIMYFTLEVTRTRPGLDSQLKGRAQLLQLQPDVLIFLSEIMDKIRWDDTINLPLTKLLLLYWKTILVAFGSSSEVNDAKSSFNEEELETSDSKGYPIITASPLDYHLFRQEISSKYPAYNPPPPLFPLEPDNNSILPPLKPSLAKMSDINAPGLASLQGHGTSILNQPVHIATPAPSPPPSPAGGGKGGKKQNYQTNQLFPFLYPPLDETSNQLGGKGSTGLQDALVGRKWEGADIPASILEAAELFAKRMRATRAMKQLWEERVEFMKYERGWKGSEEDVDIEGMDLEEEEEVGKGVVKKQQDLTPREHDGSVEDRLDAVESFYKNGLPHLQSVVMVFLRVILSNVTALITQMNGQNGLQSGFQFQEGQNGDSSKGDLANGTNGAHAAQPSSMDELDTSRSHEITAKAVSGILIMLLKWFKISHILKFEYLTQLLVDANYIPMILKLMQSQEFERIVNYRCDSEELSFFHICRANSRAGIANPSPIAPDDETSYIHQSSSEDEAAPPPIKRHRSPPKNAPPDPPTSVPPSAPPTTSLGIPTTALPTAPITTFSWRNFFSSITFLRILRKMCARHAHRNLLLVSYKSTPLLRRALKVPQPELRRYALKLVKAQVPFCGRKWRQANMRVITAVWLSIRPELRDEWLAGGDVDALVEESVPREQAVRGLVHWWHLRQYWDARSKEERRKWLEEENDFFRRELERMEWNWGTGEEGIDEADHQQAQRAAGQVWDAGMQMEAW